MICPKCGFANQEVARFCNQCGGSLSKTGNTPQNIQPVPSYETPEVLRSLCTKLRVSWILCLIEAIFQTLAFFGLGFLAIFSTCALIGITTDPAFYYDFGRSYYDYAFTYNEALAFNIVFMCLMYFLSAKYIAGAIVNCVYFARTISYVSQIQRRPVGINEHFASSGRAIGFLIVNIFLGGGPGIVGAAFYIAAGSYARSHSQELAALEQTVPKE